MTAERSSFAGHPSPQSVHEHDRGSGPDGVRQVALRQIRRSPAALLWRQGFLRTGRHQTDKSLAGSRSDCGPDLIKREPAGKPWAETLVHGYANPLMMLMLAKSLYTTFSGKRLAEA